MIAITESRVGNSLLCACLLQVPIRDGIAGAAVQYRGDGDGGERGIQKVSSPAEAAGKGLPRTHVFLYIFRLGYVCRSGRVARTSSGCVADAESRGISMPDSIQTGVLPQN